MPVSGKSSLADEESLFMKNSADVLTADFPNPDRVGCPDVLTLQRIASRKLPLTEIGPWLKHLASCSDCFRDVNQFRNREQRRRTLSWAFAGAAAVLIVLVSLIVWTNGKSGRNHQEEAILDLRNAAVSRSVESGGHQSSPAIPTLSRSARKVQVYLPKGAEGTYEMRVIDDSGTVAATANGNAKDAASSTVLAINIDLSHAPPGPYSLLLKRNATSTIYRIQVK